MALVRECFVDLFSVEAVHAMKQCIRAIRAGMQADKLKLNENKTEVMLISEPANLSKVNLGTLTVGDTSVAIVNKARNLSQLNFNVHITVITKICSLSFCSLYKIRRIRKYLSYESAQTLILALVTGRLDYCNRLRDCTAYQPVILSSCNGFKTLPQSLSPIPRVLITFLLL